MTPDQAGWAIFAGFVILVGGLGLLLRWSLRRSEARFHHDLEKYLRDSRVAPSGRPESGSATPPRALPPRAGGDAGDRVEPATSPPAPHPPTDAADPQPAAPVRRSHGGAL